jgi:glycosyltransferase involved in cell wall biosynthesis
MRIAIFTDTFLPQVNGVTNTLKRMGEYFEKNNIPYIFITPDQRTEEDIPYNVESFFSTPFFLYPECRFSMPNLLRVGKRMEHFQPDLIFCMTEFTIGLTGLLYGKKHKIPVVTNYSTNFSTILNVYNLSVLEKTLDKYLAWFHREAALTVTPSQESMKILHNMGVTKTAIFSRGIDYDQFSTKHRSHQLRDKYGLNNKLVFLYVGRLSWEKDLFVLQGAMKELNKKYKDRIGLLITGDGPMKKELENTMPDNVAFTGYKTGIELAQIYASADLFTFPSSFETFGNVVLEAAASGIPTVGVAMGGVMNIIDHGKTGLLARPKDIESFTACVEQCIHNDILRLRMGSTAREYAKEKSWDSVFDTLMTLFENQINPALKDVKRIRDEIPITTPRRA